MSKSKKSEFPFLPVSVIVLVIAAAFIFFRKSTKNPKQDFQNLPPAQQEKIKQHNLQWNSDLITQNIPKKMQIDQDAKIRIEIKNIGANSWTTSGDEVIGLRSLDKTIPWIENENELLLTEGKTIAPGENATFDFTLKAPSRAGEFNLILQLFHRKGKMWNPFGFKIEQKINVLVD